MVKTITIKNKEFKLKDYISVRCRTEYLKTLSKMQTVFINLMKEKQIPQNQYALYLEKLSSGDPNIIMDFNFENNIEIIELELKQFKILYTNLVIEPKLSDTEIEDMDSEIYDQLKQKFAEFIQANIVKDDEIKKKHT